MTKVEDHFGLVTIVTPTADQPQVVEIEGFGFMALMDGAQLGYSHALMAQLPLNDCRFVVWPTNKSADVESWVPPDICGDGKDKEHF